MLDRVALRRRLNLESLARDRDPSAIERPAALRAPLHAIQRFAGKMRRLPRQSTRARADSEIHPKEVITRASSPRIPRAWDAAAVPGSSGEMDRPQLSPWFERPGLRWRPGSAGGGEWSRIARRARDGRRG
jgi:hypothetical protein